MKRIKKFIRFSMVYFSFIAYLSYLKILMNYPPLRKFMP